MDKIADNSLRFNFLVGKNEVPHEAARNERAFASLGSKVGTFGRMAGLALGGVAVAAGGLAVAGVAMGVKTASSLEQAQIGFTTLLGSASKAQDFIKDMVQFANKTPFELQGLIDSSRMLLGYGFTVKQTKSILQDFGDATAAVGLTQDQFQRIMVQVGQSAASGRFQLQDLNAIANNGLPIWPLLSRAMGKPIPALRDMISHGQLLSKDVLPRLQAEMRKEYGGSMARQSATLAGLWSTLTDTLRNGLATAIVPLMPALRTLANDGIGFLNAAFAKLPSIITTVQTHAGQLLPTFQAIGGWLINTGQGIWKTLGPLLTQFGGWIRNDLVPALRTAATDLFPKLQAAVAGIGKVIADHRDEIRGFFSTTGSILTHELIPAVSKLAGIAASVLAPALGVIVGALTNLNTPLLAVAAGVAAGAVAFNKIGGAVDGARGRITSLRSSIEGKGGLLGVLGGPWGIAFTVATGAVALWAQSQAEAKARIDSLTDSLKADSGAWGDHTRHLVVDRLESTGALKAAQQLGINLQDVTDAAMGNAAAQQRVNAVLMGYRNQVAAASLGGVRHSAALTQNQAAAMHLSGALGDLGNDVAAATRKMNADADSNRREQQALHGTTQKTFEFAASLRQVPKWLAPRVTTPGLDQANSKINALHRGINSLSSRDLKIALQTTGDLPSRLQIYAALKGRKDGGRITGPGGGRDDRAGIFALSNGEFVVNAAATSRHLEVLQAINAGRMADGGVVGRHINYATSTRGFWPPSALMSSYYGAVEQMIANAVGAKYAASAAASSSPAAGVAGVARWAPVILNALRLIGQSSSWLNTVEARMARESGGNPRAINNWDINAQNGDPSRGLMQVIGATFRAYHVRGTSSDIYNPLANIAAGLNYAVHRYGSLMALNRPGGYDAGGLARGAGAMWKGPKPERVLSPRQTDVFERAMARAATGGRSGSGGPVEIHVHLSGSAQLVQDQIVSAFNSFARNGRLDPAVRRIVNA